MARAPVILQNESQFPMQAQIPFAQLPYQRTGSSNVTLASLGAGFYVERNSSVSPFYESTPFAAVVGVSLIVLLYLAARVAKRSRKAGLGDVKKKPGSAFPRPAGASG